MAKIFRISAIILIYLLHLSHSIVTCSATEPNVPAAPQKTEVVIIGTIHGRHYQNANYSLEVLRDIILSVKPAAILNELPLSQWDPNGRPLYRDHDKHPEGWASDTAACQLNAKQFPYDQPDREENYRRTNYFEREKKVNKLIQAWADEQAQKDPNSIDLKILKLLTDTSYTQGHLDIHAEPRNINSEGYDRLIRAKHSLRKEIIPKIIKKYPDYEILAEEGKFFKDQWHQRNQLMAENIIRIAKEYAGKRLVILTGSEHRYILRDLLKNEEMIELKEYWKINNNQI